MSYTKPNTYTSGDPISAAEVAENFKEARSALQRIDVADISADQLETYHIATPDRISPTITRYTSGVLVINKTEYSDMDKHFISDHIKQSDFTTRVMYQDIPNACCEFFLEQDASTVVHFFASGEAIPNIKQTKVGEIQLFTLWVNGTKRDATYTYLADMDETSSGATAGIFNSFATNRSVPISIFWGGELSAGSNEIKIMVDPNLEFSWINNITFIVDSAYRS